MITTAKGIIDEEDQNIESVFRGYDCSGLPIGRIDLIFQQALKPCRP